MENVGHALIGDDPERFNSLLRAPNKTSTLDRQ
jgi:hypothetical protein